MKLSMPTMRAFVASLASERSLHICVLSAFAFSEPIFAALSQQFVYLHDLGAGWLEIAFILLVLTVLLPMAWILVDGLVMAISKRYLRGYGQNLALATLFVLLWLSIIRPFMKVSFLEMMAAVWIASLIVAISGAIVSLQFYLRSLWIRRWVTLATIGLVCFPLQFVIQYGSIREPAVDSKNAIEHPIPVVMIVFDEFSGTTLMNRDLQVDDQNFPQFARLAKMSNWYRQASTVHVRTDVAIPAMLSGQFPSVRRPALESEFPGNLFQLIHGSRAFDMTVFEPVTRLCPETLRRRPLIPRPTSEKFASLIGTMSAVYSRLILPKDTPIEFPPISRLWFGMAERVEATQDYSFGLCRFDAFVMRDNQANQFMKSLHETSKPAFRFLHIELPHVPWCFLPSGNRYEFDELNSFNPAGSWGDIGEDWGTDSGIIARNEHRYLQQVRYVDRYLGLILDRLQEIKLLDRCLLIVTADHGVSFRPGHSRRVPDAATLPDLLSVPLFIKFPNQVTGKVSDANVESVDILPTIAEALEITLPETIDGISVTQTTRRPRKSLFLDKGMTILEPVIPRLEEAVERRLTIFGNDSLDHPPLRASTHPAWHGRSIDEFSVEDRPLRSLAIDPNTGWQYLGNSIPLKCLITGTLEPQGLGASSADLVVVVNKIIRDTGATYPKGGRVHGFEFLLPESLAQDSPLPIELYHVERLDPQRPHLRKIGSWKMGEVTSASPLPVSPINR